MIANTSGVVVGRRDLGEADRLCVVYTEDFGRLPVRFVGVNKAGRKLKAFSEPLVWCEYRLYLSPRTGHAKCVGGQLVASFPRLRADFARTMEALSCCELVAELTADRVPNPEKFQLLTATLAALDDGDRPWAASAFGLRFLSLCGYGLEEGGPPRDAGAGPELWAALHGPSLPSQRSFPFDPAAARRLRELVAAQVESQTGRPLRSREYWRQLSGAEAVPA